MKGTTRKQFFDELAALRQRVLELETAAAQHQHHMQALQRAAQRQEMVRRIHTAALEEHAPDVIAQLGLVRLKELAPYSRANIALFDYEARQAKILAAMTERGASQDAGAQEAGARYALEALGKDKIRAFERGETVQGEGDTGAPVGPEMARTRRRQLPAYLGVPLAVASAPIGVLNVWAAQADGFSREHIETIHALAAALSIAIHQAGQREQMQRHARELVALYNASQAMVSVLDFQPVLKAVITEAKTLLQAEMASVLLRSGDWLVFEASVGPGADAVVGTRIPISAGIAGWVLRERQPVRVSAAQHDPRFYPVVDQTTGLTTRSVLAVPLIAKGTLSGVIEVINKVEPESHEPGKAGALFYEQDLEILMALAGPAALAIENARSYQAELELSMSLQSSQAKAILQEKMAALGRFAAALDHAVGRRLAAVETALNLAQRDAHLPARRGKLASYLRMIEQDVRQVDGFVSQLRPLYQPAEHAHVPTDVRAVLEQVLAAVDTPLRQAGIAVERDWAQDLPPIQADPEQLARAFMNLASNAISAMQTQRRGKLTLRLSASQMRVSREPGAQPVPALQIELSDTGPGIPPDILPRLFEPFVTTKENSPGLGLSTSYHIIQAHHGQITVASRPGRGATFTILLPA